jgi:hypothetical protein
MRNHENAFKIWRDRINGTDKTIAMENTKLPKHPDQKAIEEKQMEIIKAYLSL